MFSSSILLVLTQKVRGFLNFGFILPGNYLIGRFTTRPSKHINILFGYYGPTMKQYKDLVRTALAGERTGEERTGAGTVLETDVSKKFDLSDGKPAVVTTKGIPYRWVAEELFWFLDGETNIRPLLKKDVTIWSSDALRHNEETFLKYNNEYDEGDLIHAKQMASTAQEVMINDDKSLEGELSLEELLEPANDIMDYYNSLILDDVEFAQKAGDLGPIYGAQWRGKNGANSIDQVSRLERLLQEGGTSRRMLVDAWNPSQLDEMALPPCHYSWQVNVKPESQKLDLVWNQRSCDTILGVPFNIASYGLLAHLLAETHDFEKGTLTGHFSNLHIYQPHEPAANEILEREPSEQPKLKILNPKNSVTNYNWEDIRLEGYNPDGPLDHNTPMFGGLF